MIKKNVILLRNWKQALSHGLVLKRVPRIIKLNQKCLAKIIYWYEYWAKQKAKNDFKKDFFKLMNSSFFGKTVENMRKHRDIRVITTEERRNYFVSEPNYHTTNFFVKIY